MGRRERFIFCFLTIFIIIPYSWSADTNRQVHQLYKNLIQEQFQNYQMDKTPRLIANNNEKVYFYFYGIQLTDLDESSMTIDAKVWVSTTWRDDQLKGWDPNSTYKWNQISITPNQNTPLYLAEVRPYDSYDTPGETEDYVVIYFTKWVEQINYFQTTLQCNRDWTTNYPHDKYTCHTYFQMQNFTKSHQVFHRLVCGTISYRDFKASTSEEMCSDKDVDYNHGYYGSSWKLLTRNHKKEKYFMTMEFTIQRINDNHFQLDVLTGVVLSAVVIINTLVPSSHKERVFIGSLILVAIFNCYYLLDEIPVTQTGELIPLIYYYIAIASIQTVSVIWSMVSLLLWQRGNVEKTAFMPDWLAMIVGYCSLALAGWKVTGELALLHQKLAQLDAMNVKVDDESEPMDATTLTFADGNIVEFGGGDASIFKSNGKKSWHYFCLVMDRLFFVIVLISMCTISIIFLS